MLLRGYLINSIGLVAKVYDYLVIRKIVNLQLVVVYFYLSYVSFHCIGIDIVITYSLIILTIVFLRPSICYLVASRMSYIFT